MAQLPQFIIDDIIKRALQEDISYVDITSDYLLSDTHQSSATIVAKQDGVLCGLGIAMRVFTLLDENIRIALHQKEGQKISVGDTIVRLAGPTKSLLKGERTALNLLQHLSGIATMTAQCVQQVVDTKVSIACTRKTLPGLRSLQKYAVTIGGGKNHRYNLSDGAMLKDNHIDAYGGIAAAVMALREKVGHMVCIEVETRSLDEVRQALDCGVSVIMLDNMSLQDMTNAASLCAGRALLEASGNITLERIAAVAKTGVDIISLGALTHSVAAFDVSMKINKG